LAVNQGARMNNKPLAPRTHKIKHRGEIVVLRLMLEECAKSDQGAIKHDIFISARTSWIIGEKYLRRLLDCGAIEESGCVFDITDKGLDLLDHLSRAKNILGLKVFSEL
jgi:predicted transcriptional regulator